MININDAARLVDRFDGMQGFGWLGETGIVERVNALTHCEDIDHAEKVIAKLQMLPMCPTVANIRREIADSRRSVSVARCGVCEDTGVEWIDSRVTDGSGLKFETWRPCNCQCEWAVHLRCVKQRESEIEEKRGRVTK